MTIVAKARNGDPASLVQPMRSLLQELDPDVPMSAVRSMKQLSSAAIAQPRLYLVLIGSFAATAMLLAAIGLYGVLAYAVGQRTREIGIRLALGAKRGEVLRMVMTQAGRLAIAGVAIGLGAAVIASRALAIAALRDRADRRVHIRGGRRRPPDRRARRQLDSGASRFANRSARGPPSRLTARGRSKDRPHAA